MKQALKPGFHIIVSVVRIVSVASSGEKTTEATETILAMNWFPLNRLHRIDLIVKKTGTSHCLPPFWNTCNNKEMHHGICHIASDVRIV